MWYHDIFQIFYQTKNRIFWVHVDYKALSYTRPHDKQTKEIFVSDNTYIKHNPL